MHTLLNKRALPEIYWVRPAFISSVIFIVQGGHNESVKLVIRAIKPAKVV